MVFLRAHLWNQSTLYHGLPQHTVERQIVKKSQRSIEDCFIRRRDEFRQLLHYHTFRHFFLVLLVYRQLLEECDCENEELHITTVEHLHQIYDDILGDQDPESIKQMIVRLSILL